MKIEIEHQIIRDPILACMNGELVSGAEWNNFIDTECNPFVNMSDDYLSRYKFRELYVNKIGYSIHTKETVETLGHYLKDSKVIEIGSGSGYLSNQLSKIGIEVTAIDNESTHMFEQVFQRDITGDIFEYMKTNPDYTDIILCWPPYCSDLAYRILDQIKPGTNIWYLGEGLGGCCADDQFFESLDEKTIYLDVPSEKLNNDQQRFEGIHDYWSVYKKE